MQRSNPPIQNRQTLNLQALNQDQHNALLALSDTTTSFQPGQAVGAQFKLPGSIYGTPINRANLKSSDIELLQNIYACSDIKTKGGLLPDKHYISIKTIVANSANPHYQAVVICPTTFIPIQIIKPTSQDNASKTNLYFLLSSHNDSDIFYKNKFYHLKNKFGVYFLITLTESIVKYTRKNQKEFGYAILNTSIGEGNQGMVYKSTHSLKLLPSHKSVTIKQKTENKYRSIKISHIKKRFRVNSATTRESAVHEYTLMAALPALFHAKLPANDNRNNKTAIISRYFAGQELYHILFDEHSPDFSMQQRIELCLNIAKKLQILHDGNIIHRDIKPENIIARLNCNNDVVAVHIIDLGYGISTADANIGGGASPGTPIYAAPEVFDGVKPTFAVDNFSLGRLFMVILSRIDITILFDSNDKARSLVLPEISTLFPGCNANLAHPLFIQSCYYLLARMNEKNPSNRIELPVIIEELEHILEAAKSHDASCDVNNSANTSTAAAAASTLGLFTTAQTTSIARTGSDAFYSPMPTGYSAK